MFEKLVAIEPVNLIPEGEKFLFRYAKDVVLYGDIPADDDEIVRRIGDADAVLLSYTSRISEAVFARCPGIKYVGMCCSLYSKESANVDIAWAEHHGVIVKGIRDYGDQGVVEFTLSELVRFLHGYDRPMWKTLPTEITDLKVGIVGLGVSGTMVAEALQFMGADVRYYSRTRKPEKEAAGIRFQPLEELLSQCEAVFACLNKNVLLLGKREFEALGSGKLLFNTSIGPAFAPEDLSRWLEDEKNYFICDTAGAIGDKSLMEHPRVFCADASAGRTAQSFRLLTEKVLKNIEDALKELQ